MKYPYHFVQEKFLTKKKNEKLNLDFKEHKKKIPMHSMYETNKQKSKRSHLDSLKNYLLSTKKMDYFWPKYEWVKFFFWEIFQVHMCVSVTKK